MWLPVASSSSASSSLASACFWSPPCPVLKLQLWLCASVLYVQRQTEEWYNNNSQTTYISRYTFANRVCLSFYVSFGRLWHGRQAGTHIAMSCLSFPHSTFNKDSVNTTTLREINRGWTRRDTGQFFISSTLNSNATISQNLVMWVCGVGCHRINKCRTNSWTNFSISIF